MTFKPAIWFPIAVASIIINLVGLGYAVRADEPAHAMIHGVLAVGFWLWARRLRSGPPGGERASGLEAIEGEVSRLRQELTETQERLDFAERLLAQGSHARRQDSQREER